MRGDNGRTLGKRRGFPPLSYEKDSIAYWGGKNNVSNKAVDHYSTAMMFFFVVRTSFDIPLGTTPNLNIPLRFFFNPKNIT